ncbi:MAG: enoyl-CoA hydratase/isomerase family protein [Hyphomicrobiaceae bacterium]|nr:enoyl-CoA hydratase/isomerase family protein [Hyphomicrobiaceae bacterium]
MSQFVIAERMGHVLEITLSRPPANAINAEVGRQLHKTFRDFQDDPELRVGILTGGSGRIFSAGWDLKEVAKETDAGEANDAVMNEPGGFAGITELWERTKPVLGALNGAAVGGGFEMALALDVLIAVEEAEFWLPEMQRGFVPDAGAVQRLPRKVPYNVAMEMMLTGRRMSAKEAVHWGLVQAAVSRDELMPRARELARTIAEGAPLALQALLEIAPEIDRLPLKDAFARTKRGASGLPIYERMITSEDFLEGPRAFAEKRKPVWKGR